MKPRTNLLRALSLLFLFGSLVFSTLTNPRDQEMLAQGAQKVAMAMAWIGGWR